MTDEPVKTKPNSSGTGRPETTDEQFMEWLLLMQPYLQRGNTLWYAMEKTDLLGHEFIIYGKYKLNDWFSRKVDAMRRTPGELVNNVLVREVERINAKILDNGTLTREDIDILKTMADKHRTAQPFFVTRTETAEANPDKVGKILDTMETNYDDVGQQADKQMVAADPPVQDKGQTGSDSNV